MKVATFSYFFLALLVSLLFMVLGGAMGEYGGRASVLYLSFLAFFYMAILSFGFFVGDKGRAICDYSSTFIYLSSVSFSIFGSSQTVAVLSSISYLSYILLSKKSTARESCLFFSIWVVFLFIFNVYMIAIVDLVTHYETGLSPMWSYDQIEVAFFSSFIMWGTLQLLLYFYRKEGGWEWPGVLLNILLLYPAYYGATLLLPKIQ